MQAQNPGTSGNQSGNQNSSSNSKPTLSWSQPASSQSATKTTNTATTNAKPAATAAAKGSAERSAMSAYIGVFVAGLVVGILVGWGITGLRGSSSSTMTATSTNATSSTSAATSKSTSANINLGGAAIGSASSSGTAPSSGVITVASPQKAGSSVAVSGVTVTKPTWVAIYDDVNGKQGGVLGAQMFFPTSQGGKTSGTISLVHPTMAGKTYLVGELIDNGSHTFSSKLDQAVVVNGSTILAQFKAQ